MHAARRAGPALAYLVLPLLYAVGVWLIPGYGSWSSLTSMLVLASFLGIASIGQTLAVLLGGIDLSIPAVIGMADVLTARWYGAGVPFAAAVVAILALAAAIGATNGLLARALRVHPLIVTLAMNFVVLGAVLVETGGQTTGTVPGYLTEAVSPVGTVGPLLLPPIVVLWLLLAALLVFAERGTLFGRFLLASGASERAARLALVPVGAVWVGAFALSAVFAAVAGVLLAGFSGGADANVGQPYLFETVAAVVVGGTTLLGGAGGYARTVAGTLLITLLTTLLIGLGLTDRVQQILLGVLIIALVGAYGREPHVRMQV